MRSVHLKGFSIRAPGISSNHQLAEVVKTGTLDPEFEAVRLPDETDVELARPRLPDDVSYIDRRDKKILNTDLIAAIDCAKELTQTEFGDTIDATDIPLYMATGVVLDRILGDISPVLTGIFENQEAGSPRNMAELVNESLPPLLGLRCLTNSINHFIARYTGLLGESTTYGSTSNSAWSALRDAYSYVACGRGDYAVVGAVNEVGIVHSMTYHASPDRHGLSRESAASVFVLLTSGDKPGNSETGSGAEIREIGGMSRIAFGDNDSGPGVADQVTVSDDELFLAGSARVVPHSSTHPGNPGINWQDLLGYTGVAGVLLNLVSAQVELNAGSAQSAVCLDTDDFGRGNWLRLVAVD